MSARGLKPLMSFIVLVLTPVLIGAATNSYTERFITTEKKNTAFTTANWDTVAGRLELGSASLEIVGNYDTPSNARDVVVCGDYAFVADNTSGLQIIDVTNPASPVAVGSYDTPSNAFGLYVSGRYAYIADGLGELEVVDVGNPASPVLAGTYAVPGVAYDVAVDGDFGYIAIGTYGLQVVDVSNPAVPALVGSYNTPHVALAVAASGDFVFVADNNTGVQIIDVSDPAAPTLAGSYDTDNARDVFLAGNHLYVANGIYGLWIFDVSNPSSPALTGSLDTPDNALGVCVWGDRAYVADENAGLIEFDVSDPTSPLIVGTADTPGAADAVAVSGEYCLVADGTSGLQIVQIADAVPPAHVGSYAASGQANGVYVWGDHAYVAGYDAGLRIIDISDPSSPTAAGFYDTPDYAHDVFVEFQRAYVADYFAGLHIIDVSDVTNPVLLGSYDTPDRAVGVEVAGNHAYVADASGGLRVIDVSDPTTPTEVGYYALGTYYAVDVSGDLAYIASGLDGLLVLDISDPTTPTQVSLFNTWFSNAYDIAVCGGYAYVPAWAEDGFAGLMAIDISNPASPSVAGTVDLDLDVRAVSVAGDHAYVAHSASGLQVVDISDPTSPQWTGTFDTPGFAYNVFADGTHAYIADGFVSGLQVVEVTQSDFANHLNVGQSLPIDELDDDVMFVRMTSTQVDSVLWESSANGGAAWQTIVPDGSWSPVAASGSDLVWRASLYWTDARALGVSPSVSEATFDWLYEYAVIDSIVDVPNDQGGWVYIHFSRSGHDFASEPVSPITGYTIYRRGEGTDWVSVGNTSATYNDHYISLVPTVGDSSASFDYSVYKISAETSTPSVFFEGPPDSGFSVDNLPPEQPQGFSVAYNTGEGNHLSWEPSGASDFEHFRVYRGMTSDFEPAPGNLVHSTSSVEWNDPEYDGWNVYYKITAVDEVGNESEAASSGTTTAAPADAMPERFALYPNTPNPFNPATTIRFDVPAGGDDVTLEIFDVEGRYVTTLVDGARSEGAKSISWNGTNAGGVRVSSGVYFYRLKAPGYEKTLKMILLK